MSKRRMGLVVGHVSDYAVELVEGAGYIKNKRARAAAAAIII